VKDVCEPEVHQVYSPFQRQWSAVINENLDQYLAEAASPSANAPTVKDHPIFGKMFSSEVPSHVEGFQCLDKDQMTLIWPAGVDAAHEVYLAV
jgi:deoxyribodipyrimidine photo-lyase